MMEIWAREFEVVVLAPRKSRDVIRASTTLRKITTILMATNDPRRMRKERQGVALPILSSLNKGSSTFSRNSMARVTTLSSN